MVFEVQCKGIVFWTVQGPLTLWTSLCRFSLDIDTLDEAIPDTLNEWLTSTIEVIGTVFVISAVTPYFLIVVGVLFLVLHYLIQVHTTTGDITFALCLGVWMLVMITLY